MRVTIKTTLAILLFLAISAVSPEVARAESIDIGPKIGAHIPEPFVVTNASGALSFKDIAGEKGVVIAFVRSAAWCPYCQLQLKEIQRIVEPLKKMGLRLVSISYDAPDVLTKFTARVGTTYPMLSDKGSVMIDAFDIRDPQYKEGSTAYGVPKPVIFIVDQDGIVRGKLAEEGYKVRPTPEAILAAAQTAVNP